MSMNVARGLDRRPMSPKFAALMKGRVPPQAPLPTGQLLSSTRVPPTAPQPDNLPTDAASVAQFIAQADAKRRGLPPSPVSLGNERAYGISNFVLALFPYLCRSA